MISVTAYMWARDEADIVGWTVGHLLGQGVNVVVFDDWSTDGTLEIVQDWQRLHPGWVRVYPKSGSANSASLREMCEVTESVALLNAPGWALHHDADELLRSQMAGETVADTLRRLGAAGYNAVESAVQTYAPSDRFVAGSNPEDILTEEIPGHVDTRTRHVRAWLQGSQRVDVATRGGHFVNFPGVRVAPERLHMKHYPLRTTAQAARKVADRRSRWSATERARGWHSHYDGLKP
jgi:hypothetical protein